MINRRNFIKTGTYASIASILPISSCSSSFAKKKELGLQIHSVRPQLTSDFNRTLEKIAEIGFKNIEAYGLGNDGLFIEKITPKTYKKTLVDLGMNLLSTHINYFDLTHINKIIDSCHEAGVKYGIIPIPPEEYRTSISKYKEFAEYLNKVGEKFNESGIIFGFHNHDFLFYKLESEIPYEILLNETEPKFVTFQADLYWMTKGGVNPLDLIYKFPGRFKSFHVKDIDKDNNRESVGLGIIDFESILNARDTAGLQDYFIEDFRPDNDPFGKLKISFDYLMKSDFA